MPCLNLIWAERVYFFHQERRIVGVIIRLNQKSISIHTDDGIDWTVTPDFLSKIIEK